MGKAAKRHWTLCFVHCGFRTETAAALICAAILSLEYWERRRGDIFGTGETTHWLLGGLQVVKGTETEFKDMCDAAVYSSHKII